jgi:hypothetical protein
VADSKRLQILKALKEQLKLIAHATGYNDTVKNVTYGYLPLSKVNQYPTICMIPLDGIFTPLTNDEYTSGGGRNTLDGWPVAILSYVKNARSEEALSDSREKMIQDVVRAINTDRHLGLPSFVHSTYYVSCEGTLDIEESIAVVTQIFSIKYDFNIDEP